MGLRFATTVTVVLSAMTGGRADLLLSPGVAVQAPAQPVFSARSELVVLYVMVKDRKGAHVPGLRPEAFAVFEDGQRQAIQFFATQDAPVTVGLLIDSSGSMLPVRDRVEYGDLHDRISRPTRAGTRALDDSSGSPI